MEIPYEVFKSSVPIQIRFNDIDAIGHINNNIYFSYFDLGKTNYFEKIRAEKYSWVDVTIVMARSEVDFLSPIYYKEKIAVDTKILKLGNKSGVFLQQIRNIKTNEVKCRCKSIFVAYNSDIQASVSIPDSWREAISTFEEVEFKIEKAEG